MAHSACSGACWPTEVFWTSQQAPELPLLLQIMLVPHIKQGSILSCRLITDFGNSVLNCDDVLQCWNSLCQGSYLNFMQPLDPLSIGK